MKEQAGAAAWARNEFGATDLGDVRRTKRLVTMAIGAARRPSGKVSVVFDRSREREGAYDFLESPHVDADAVASSVFDATLRRARGLETAFVAIDGSSLSLTDETGSKGFGPVGSPNREVTGLLMMNALAITREGVPLGLIDQLWWNRAPANERTRRERMKANAVRPFEDKETFHVLRAARNAIARLAAGGTRAWIVVDREADNRDILLGLHEADCLFTVRGGKYDRRVLDEETSKVQELLDAEPSLGTYEVEAKRRGGARKKVIVDIRAAQVTLRFSAYGNQAAGGLRLYAVRIRDASGAPDGPDWLLYTNVPVLSAEHARAIVASYEMRWRVEEFHRTWKQGQCNVEDAQLHTEQAVIVWATILAAIATRIERLKYLSRQTPDVPATIELRPEEVEALKLDQKRRWTKPRRVPKEPTIAVATRWVAELGGWIGPRNGPPGSVTLARGLERLGYLVEGIALARQPPHGVRRT
jgi:hypothetical protein